MPNPYIDLNYAVTLPPAKAIDYFQGKGFQFSWSWADMLDEAHNQAFTVAKAMDMDILQDIRAEVNRALTEGITFQEFQNNLTPRLQAQGWWGRQVIDGNEVQLGSPYRLETIYKTNMQSAYNSGRWQGFEDQRESHPYLRYIAVMDSATRPDHAALNGMVFHIDDPFWQTHYPPLGFRCRCRVGQLSRESVESRGLTVSDSKDGKLKSFEVDLANGKKAMVTEFKGFNPATGREFVSRTDPSFNFNAGMKSWSPTLKNYPPPLRKQFTKAVKAETKSMDILSPDMAGKHKNIKDAQAWATRYVANDVDYSKTDIYVANLMNKEMSKITDKGMAISRIGPKVSRDGEFFSWSMSTDVKTGYVHDIIFNYNPKMAGNKSLFNSTIKELQKRNLMLDLDADGVMTHERGHFIAALNAEDSFVNAAGTLDELIAEHFDNDLRTMKYYIGKQAEVSGEYIMTNVEEQFAEFYRMWNEDKLIDDLKFIGDFMETLKQ